MIRKLSKSHFWKWFTRNNKEFLSSKKNQAEINYWLSELNAHLRAYWKFMRFKIELSHDRKSGILTICADGKANHFDRIDHFVFLAPKIPNWQFYSLEQPKPAGFMIEEDFGSNLIDPDDLWFNPVYDPCSGEMYDFTIYSAMYTKARSKQIYPIVRAILWNILGERMFGEKIWDINIENRSRAPREVQLIKLEELPAYFDHSISCIVVNSAGQLQYDPLK